MQKLTRDLFASKVEIADGGRERRTSSSERAGMKTKWLKAFKSLKSSGFNKDSGQDRRNGREGREGSRPPDGPAASSLPVGAHWFQEYTYKKITACDACNQILRAGAEATDPVYDLLKQAAAKRKESSLPPPTPVIREHDADPNYLPLSRPTDPAGFRTSNHGSANDLQASSTSSSSQLSRRQGSTPRTLNPPPASLGRGASSSSGIGNSRDRMRRRAEFAAFRTVSVNGTDKVVRVIHSSTRPAVAVLSSHSHSHSES
ncbi:hypothetical protein FJT64_005926 [Amphibalanus amphitrite]|uniref:Uncharacterized protein n=1 Tax=Amphibalanus amphitrite TaxID=1232801 RepID=A0A6A4VR00_AMPAM|nr:hypothetical protein FJT64_005926 [Amphibalanus amphitrite]